MPTDDEIRMSQERENLDSFNGIMMHLRNAHGSLAGLARPYKGGTKPW